MSKYTGMKSWDVEEWMTFLVCCVLVPLIFIGMGLNLIKYRMVEDELPVCKQAVDKVIDEGS